MRKLTDGDDLTLRALALSWIAAEHLPQNSGQRRSLIESAIDQYEADQLKAAAWLVEAKALLGNWKTHLGSDRSSCDETGTVLWDRISALLD